MKDGFLKSAAVSPSIKVADCEYNTGEIIKAIDEASKKDVSLLTLPELAITSYSCEDLFLQDILLDSAKKSLVKIALATKGKNIVVVVGFPVTVDGKLYNAAAVTTDGEILGIVPKSFIPNYTEFYEGRRFSEAPSDNGTVEIEGKSYPFGTKLLFKCREMPEFVLGVEICEDLFVSVSPSSLHTLAGATVIANPSASDEIVCKPDFRRKLVAIQSGKSCCGYVYCNAHETESTTDVVFSAHNIIAENGSIIAESAPFKQSYCESEIDLNKIENERRRLTSVRYNNSAEGYKTIEFSLKKKEVKLTRRVASRPFIPSNDAERHERCEDILNIQCAALKKRIVHSWAKTAVIGVSGGLDSPLALLVTSRAFQQMGRPAPDIIGISMPCFGTTKRTKSNAQTLCETLGISFREIDISESVKSHLKDMGHDGTTFDVSFENAQARERTQLLMDVANMENGLVIGTGDLSELALGWCTYNGDHMSMYAVNCSVPKTLVRYLVKHIADEDETIKPTLYDILDTPVSPELLPSDGKEINQKTEDIIGPYELHDFFLYYSVRWGFSPKKIMRLAKYAFAGEYTDEEIEKWLKLFYKRFFIHQFKRSCVPNGPKIGSVSLSPRGDFRMPADASSALWLKEFE